MVRLFRWIQEYFATWGFFSLQPPHQPRGPRWRLILELTLVCCFLLLHLWEPAEWLVDEPQRRVARAWIRGMAVCGVAFFLIGSMVRLKENVTQLGLTRQAIVSGWGPMLVVTGVLLALTVVGGLLMGKPMDMTERGVWLAKYLPGMMFQQVALQWFLNNRVYYLTSGAERRRRIIAATVACALFVLMHAPNPVLMVGVAVAGWYWCWHFRCYQNLAAVMTSHVVLGVAAMAMMGETWMMRLRVGWPVITWLAEHPHWPQP